jgi:hypothetical protein
MGELKKMNPLRLENLQLLLLRFLWQTLISYRVVAQYRMENPFSKHSLVLK